VKGSILRENVFPTITSPVTMETLAL
jgi:hypothetical protein